MLTLGEKIVQLRKDKDISQEALGFELGVSRTTIGKWENNTMKPNYESIKGLCKFFNVKSSYFLDTEIAEELDSGLNGGEAAEEIAISDVSVNNKKRRIYIALLVLFSALCVISLFVTILYAFVVFSTNTGFVSENTVQYPKLIFIIGLIFSIVLSALICLMIFLLKKTKM